MKRILAVVISFSFAFQFMARADEGMWLPILIEKYNIETMQKMGCKLTAEQIFSINNSSMKDAIVALDHGSCTGELVSSDGLILTNHHCGYGEIQAHSSVEHDYLADGFWAMTREEELPNPGKVVSFLISVKEVTDEIIPFLSDTLSEYERYEKADQISQKLADEAMKGNHYEASVESMFNHNSYYLFVYETFTDIRLVGAPPSSIGKFGGDVDNWMWPRHTGDFSMFRVYCGPDGKPAEFAPENVPYHPKHHLPVSLEGYEKGDYAMILGYPGSTDRYLTSYGIKELMEITNPNRVKIRGIKQEIWGKDMEADANVRIQYAAKYSQSANYWKYSIGQNKGLKRLDVYGQKKQLEDQFSSWVNDDQARTDKYGNALTLIDKAYQERREYRNALQYMNETMVYYGTEIIPFTNSTFVLYRLLRDMPDSTVLIDATIKALTTDAEAHFKDYNSSTDQKVFAALISLYHNDSPEAVHISMYPEIMKKYKNDMSKYAAYVFSKTNFSDQQKYLQLINSKDLKAFDKDPAFTLMRSVIGKYYEIYSQYTAINENLRKGERLFLGGLLEMNPDKAFYPDANSTMRITYGTVGDYKSRDAVDYYYQTTMKGIIEKYDPNDEANFFNTPQRLLDIYQAKDFGRYGMGDEMPVAFLTNNDITGGNSGSPVINGKGHLIGIAFDGNWEAMSGDIAFEDALQKCINVDIRYVLLIIDKYAGAKHLVDEMTLIEKNTEEPSTENAPVEEMEMMTN